jgi:hypothetical protein
MLRENGRRFVVPLGDAARITRKANDIVEVKGNDFCCVVVSAFVILMWISGRSSFFFLLLLLFVTDRRSVL